MAQLVHSGERFPSKGYYSPIHLLFTYSRYGGGIVEAGYKTYIISMLGT